MERLLKGKKILIGVTGSISAYKSPLIIRELIKYGCEVKVVMTPSAKEFVTPITLASVSKNQVVSDMFDSHNQEKGAWHIHLAHWCDLFLIAPCSATSLGKLTHGIADNALIAVALATPRNTPILIAPAMDFTMYESPATQRNLSLLESFGYKIIPPATGGLASGLSGIGRLADINDIIQAIANELNLHINTSSTNDELLNKSLETLDESVEKIQFNTELEFSQLKLQFALNTMKSFFNRKNILITAGPTIEQIDAVRYISNSSSGKMGFALAEVANNLGANVTLISGPVNLSCSTKIHRVDVTTAEEMYNKVVENYSAQDIFIMAAAVADFTPLNKSINKIKKNQIQNNLVLELVPTKDILLTLGKIKKEEQILVGFALETDDEIENGIKKLQQKNADLIVINSAMIKDSAFQSDNNQVVIINKYGKRFDYDKLPKKEVAFNILQKIAELQEYEKNK
jgi:phosphopantothenoylcysteine decarboxylase/phosphopantothenate--cysteine ligase